MLPIAMPMDSQAKLEEITQGATNAKLAADEFTASKPGRTEITCRAVGPIKTPDGQTFEDYIRKALVDQLRLARLYSPDVPTRIRGNVDDIDFSSHNGSWTLIVTLSDVSGRYYTVREDYDYKTSFVGETACNQTAQALMPAVQDLINKIISAPEFRTMFSLSSGSPTAERDSSIAATNANLLTR